MHESEKWKWSHLVVSDSSRPHGLKPTRPLHPWDFPSKSTGVGCHCLLHLSHSIVFLCCFVDVTGDRIKLWCCKEQYCIGTWNVRSMDQGKLEVVKQETSRVNVNILGISELKWTGMGEFNSDDHFIYYCGKESLGRNGVAITVKKKRLKCSTWMKSQKWQKDLCSFPRQTIQYHGNPSLCPNQ